LLEETLDSDLQAVAEEIEQLAPAMVPTDRQLYEWECGNT
jgi:hypothetical protein